MTKRRIGLAIATLAIATSLWGASVVAQERANHHQRISAGFMGCMPREVEIAEREVDNGVETWVARCRGAMFTCVWLRGSPTVIGGQAQCAELRRSR